MDAKSNLVLHPYFCHSFFCRNRRRHASAGGLEGKHWQKNEGAKT
jgi:hypothetical protein